MKLTACTAGAVLGDGFDFEQLCQVAGLDESKGLPAVDKLLRRVLHRRALEVLEAVVPPAELVRHALAAGLSERAFDLSVSVGDEAMRLFAVRDAISYYEQAQTLTTGNPFARLSRRPPSGRVGP